MSKAIVKETKIYNECECKLAQLNDQHYCDLAKDEYHMQ